MQRDEPHFALRSQAQGDLPAAEALAHQQGEVVAVIPAVLTIGSVTFIFSAAGIKAGSVFGYKYKSKAELCGGIILILLGIKILLEGVGVL